MTADGPFPPLPLACPMLDCWVFDPDAPKLDPEVPELEPENPPWEPLPCWPDSLIDDLAGEDKFDILGRVE